MELTEKDIKAIAEKRFESKLFKGYWLYIILILVALTSVNSLYFNNYYSDKKEAVLSYMSDSGKMVTLSTNYNDTPVLLVSDGKTVFAMHEKFVEYNGEKYNVKSGTLLDNNSLTKKIDANLRTITIVMILLISGLFYFMLYKPCQKFKADFLKEYRWKI